MMLFGIPMLQQMAGPGNFMANMMPGQNVADQLLAARYQQATRSAALAANASGNADVSTKIQGFATALVGGGASPLNKESADNIAGMLNNPVGKQVLGSIMGPDTLEGVMFGSKGDPALLAAAVNKIGFYRRDTLGGERMSGRSLENLTKSVHANMYGPGADIDDMHGFSGGQSAQMMEHLFQRGMLPQSLGALSPAERVKAVSEKARDEPTMNRLAEEFAHRELLKSDTKFHGRTFAETTEEEQKNIVKDQLPTYRGRLDDTMRKIDDFREADHSAKSPAEMEKELGGLEKLGGYDLAAGNVDASRTADKVKKFSGAVAAVREIFGDNGNTNAPMPQLLAALEHLSQGTISQVGAGKVESTLRQLRLSARDAGMGFEQLAGISAQTGAYGDTLGLSRTISTQNTLNATMMSKAMRDAGAFNEHGFGKLNQAEAGQEAAMRMQRGDASGVGVTLAAVARAVESNPEAYKSSPELQAMAKAYKEGKETFTVGGKTHNIAEMAGMGGAQAVTNFFAAHGGNVNTLRAYAIDPNTQENMKAGYVYRAQRYQLQRDIANEVMSHEVMQQVNRPEFDAAAIASGIAPDRLEAQKHGFAKDFSLQLTKTIMEETGSMDATKRAEHLQARAPEMLKEMFVRQGLDPVVAESRAAALLPALLGGTKAEQLDNLGRMAAQSNAFVVARTGHGIVGEDQLTNKRTLQLLEREQYVAQNRAERHARMTRGHETTIAQRLGDELDRIGTSGTFDAGRFAASIGNALKKTELRDAYAPELAGAFAGALSNFNSAAVNTSDVTKAYAEARAGGPGAAAAIEELKSLAGVDSDTEVVSSTDIATKLNTKADAEITALYRAHVGGTATSRADQIDAISKSHGIGAVEGVLDPAKKQTTLAQLEATAKARRGQAKGASPEEREQNKKEIGRVEQLSYAMMNADDMDAVEEASRALAEKTIETQGLAGDAAERTKAKFKAAGLGDKTALAELETFVDENDFTQLSGLHGSSELAKKGIVLSSAGVSEGFGDAIEEEKRVEAATLAAKAKRLKDSATAAGSTTPDAAADGATTPPADGERVATAEIRAETVQLAAETVSFSRGREDDRASGSETRASAAAADATRETGQISPVSLSSTEGKNELTINGTLQVRGMREAVLAAVGQPPVDTGDGAPVFS